MFPVHVSASHGIDGKVTIIALINTPVQHLKRFAVVIQRGVCLKVAIKDTSKAKNNLRHLRLWRGVYVMSCISLHRADKAFA